MSRASAALLLVLLTAATLGLRARGIGFSLPHATHADARVLVDQVAALRSGEPDPEGHRLYPHLVPRVAALFGEPGERPIAPDADAARHRARASGAWLRARWVAVGFSVALVPLTYLLARALLAGTARAPALLAAALVATSLLHQSFAQQERPHSALAATTVLAVLLAIGLRRRPDWPRYLLAGLGAALAVGALHSGLAVLPALAAAHLLRERPSPGGHLRALLPLALVALAVPVFYPFHFGGHPTGTEGLHVDERAGEQVLDLSGHNVRLRSFDGSGFGQVAGTLVSYDPALTALLLLGLASLALWRARPATGSGPTPAAPNGRDVLVALAYVLPYLLAIGLYGKTPERFVMPLIPFVAVLAARPLALALERRGRTRVVATLWCLAVVLAGALVWRLGDLRRADDTYTRVAHWLEAEVPPGERVVLVLDPDQDLPLIKTPAAAEVDAAWPWASRWATYLAAQPSLPPGRDVRVPAVPGGRLADLARDPLGRLHAAGARYAVVELVGGGKKSATQRAVHAGLAEGAELVHRVSPSRDDDGGSGRMFIRSVSWSRPMFQRILAAHCVGPTLEVYRLRP